MIKIIEIGDFAWQGTTKPVFCRGDDGFEYVVKGPSSGYHALVAEWVAGRLGLLLGLPIPEIQQALLVPELLKYGADREKLQKLGSGVLFCSRKIPNVNEFRDSDLKRIDLTLQARVLAFDLWIANFDRMFARGRLKNPNLLLVEGGEKLIVIDHNLAFQPGETNSIVEMHPFRGAKSIWTTSFRGGIEAEFRIALAELQTIWNELPEEWTAVESGFSLASLKAILWKFDTDATSFWNPL